MRVRTAKLAGSAAVLTVVSLLAPCLRAQESEATLSGKVTDSSGAVANAKVSVRNLATSQSMEAQTDAAGTYSLAKLAPGEYEVTVSAEGLAPKKENVILAAGASLTFNAELSLLPSAPQAQPQTPANNAPNAPPGTRLPLSGTWAFLPPTPKAIPRNRRCWINGRTC